MIGIYYVLIQGNTYSGESMLEIETSIGVQLKDLSEACQEAGFVCATMQCVKVIEECMANGCHFDEIPHFSLKDNVDGNVDLLMSCMVSRPPRFVHEDDISCLLPENMPLIGGCKVI